MDYDFNLDMQLKMPKREEVSHKGTFGRVLNIAGSDYMSGAAFLSSLSALRTGCGFVTLASTQKVIDTVSSMTPDITFLPISKAKDAIKDYDVISIGCGLSVDTTLLILFNAIMVEAKKYNKPVIIDADGLNILSKIKNVSLPSQVIITPHPKEVSRLLGVEIEKILSKPSFYAKKLSKKYNCVTVLKLHRSIICSPELEVDVNTTGNSAMAKAGSGDVLCGIITALVAQKMSVFDAAKLGCYIHGKAGEIASEFLTKYSVLASDQLEYIPLAISKLT